MEWVGGQWIGGVSVIDGATNTVIATVPAPSGATGVAVNPATNRVYVESGGGVLVVDGVSSTIVGQVNALGQFGIAANPATNRIYVTWPGGDSVSVIDGLTNSVGDPVTVGDYPVDLAVNSVTNRVYVANAWSNDVSGVDGVTNTVPTTIAVHGDHPTSIAVNPATNRIYVATLNGELDDRGVVSVIDGESAAVVAAVVLPGYYTEHLFGIAADPTTNRIYVGSHGEGGKLFIMDGATNAVVGSVVTGASAQDVGAVAVNSATHHIYVTDAFGDDEIVVIQDPIAVGGLAEPPQLEPEAVPSGRGSTDPSPFAIAGIIGGSALLLVAGGWHARRRWQR